MFFAYGPQAPTSFCNAPTCVELQGDWIADCLDYMRETGYSVIEATEEAAAEWKGKVDAASSEGLLAKVDSVSHPPSRDFSCLLLG